MFKATYVAEYVNAWQQAKKDEYYMYYFDDCRPADEHDWARERIKLMYTRHHRARVTLIRVDVNV